MVWQTSTIHEKMEHKQYPALDQKSQIHVTQAQQSKEFTTTTANIRGDILILQNKTHNRRIHHIHQLSSSQILKQLLPTTMHRFYKTKQCNTNTYPRTQINETQNNYQTISKKTNIGSKTINSPSLCTELPLSTRGTEVIVLPFITSSLPPNKLASVIPKKHLFYFPCTIRQDGNRYPFRQRRIHTILSNYIKTISGRVRSRPTTSIDYNSKVRILKYYNY